jgi:hypothetical protein
VHACSHPRRIRGAVGSNGGGPRDEGVLGPRRRFGDPPLQRPVVAALVWLQGDWPVAGRVVRDKDASHLRHVEASQLNQVSNLRGRELKGVLGVHPAETFGDFAVRNVDGEGSARSKYAVRLDEEVGQIVRPQVLDDLAGEHKVDLAVGDHPRSPSRPSSQSTFARSSGGADANASTPV